MKTVFSIDVSTQTPMLYLLQSNITQEPILALERIDKVILVTATQPSIEQASCNLWGFFSFSQNNLPNFNPYQLSIQTLTPANLRRQASTVISLKTAKISNECADSLESAMLNAAKLFATNDNACLLIVKLLRQCTDNSIREKWLDDIFGRSTDNLNSYEGCKGP